MGQVGPFPARRRAEAGAPATGLHADDSSVGAFAEMRLFHSLETGDHLRTQTGELGLGDHFIYRPGDGFTLGQYLIGRSAGGSPVSGSVQIDGGGQIHSLRPGELVELDLGGGAWDAAIASLDQSLEGGNLRAVSVSALLRSSGR